jgi:hypothetical protein
MKKSLVDVKGRQLSRYKSKVDYINKFIHKWGKTVVNGEEVLNERNYIYPMEDQAEEFLRWSGGLESVRHQSWKGIKKAWLYINPSKDQELKEELVAANITLAATRAPDDFQFRVGIPLESETGRLILAASESFRLHGNIDRYKKELKAELCNRKDEIYDKFTPRTKYPDACVDALAKTVLLYGEYDIATISTGIDQVSRIGTDWNDDTYSYTVNVSILSITFTSVFNDYDEKHPVVKAILEHKQDIKPLYPEEGAEDGTYGGLSFNYNTPTPTIPSIWVRSNYHYYLKTSFLRTGIVPDTGAYIKLSDRIELLSAKGFVDSGYEEKSCDFWCSITIVVIIIIAAVASYYAGPEAGVSIMAIAKAIIVFALVLTVAAAVLEGTGDVVAARGISRLNKSIAPIVQIAGLVLVVTCMMDWADSIENVASNMADDADMATLESSSQFEGMSTWTSGSTVAERTASSAVDDVKALAGDSFDLNWENGVKWVSQVADMIQKNELAKLKKEIKSKQDKLAELQQAKEDNAGGNPAMDYQINYANVMLLDWSGYSIFERPYSGYQPKYGGGNVQRTEVGALVGMGADTYYR